MSATPEDDCPLLLYDGDCGFCHDAARFYLRHEADDAMRFAALASPTGRAALGHYGLPADFDKSLVLIEGGRAYVFSAAVLRIALHLKAPWRWAALGSYVPRPLRDAAYGLVARYRGLLAHKPAACELPDPAARGRFVDIGCRPTA